jgi:hypothetical protein
MAEPSKFLPYQDKNGDFLIDQCEIDLPGPIEKVCLDCKPNPKALVDNWRNSINEPFLNERVCLYQVGVQTLYTETGGSDESLKEKFEEYKAQAIDLFLTEYDKEYTSATFLILEKSIQYDLQTGFELEARNGSRLKLLFSVPFENLEEIDDADDDEEEEDEEQEPITVTYQASEFVSLLLRVRKGLNLYARYVKYYKYIDEENLIFTESRKLFDLDRYGDSGFNRSKTMAQVLIQLDRFLKSKGYNIPGGGAFGIFKDKVVKLTFGFDTEFKLKKLKVFTVGCAEKPIVFKGRKIAALNRREVFKDRTAMGYLAQLKEMDNDLTARAPKKFTEFLLDYTYPPISVVNSVELQASLDDQSCVAQAIADKANSIGQDVLDDVLGLGDAIAGAFHDQMCKQLEDVRREQEEMGANYRPIDDLRQRALERQINRKLNKAERELAALKEEMETTFDDDLNILTDAEIKEKEKELREERRKAKKEKKKEKKKERKDARKALGAAAAEQAYKELQTNPNIYVRLCADVLISKTKLGDAISSREIFDASINPMKQCGLLDILIDAIQCLFGGLTLQDALLIMCTKALQAMGMENFGILFAGLSPEEQQKLDELVKQKIAEAMARGETRDPTDFANVTDINERTEQGTEDATGRTAPRAGSVDANASMNPFKNINFVRPFQKEELLERERSARVPGAYESTTVSANQYEAESENFGIRRNIGTVYPQVVSVGGTLTQTDLSGYQTPVANAINSVKEDASKIFSDSKIMEAYINALIQLYADRLLDLVDMLNQFPGAEIISKALATLDCPKPPLFTPSIMDFIKDIELPFCRNINDITFPKLFLPELNILKIIKELVKAVMQAIRDLFYKILFKLLVKVCEILGEAICKALETTGDIIGNLPGLISGNTTFRDVIRESICGPQAPEEQIDQAIQDLFSTLGGAGAELANRDRMVDFTEAVASSSTRQEIINASLGEADPEFLTIVDTIIEFEFPELREAFSNINDIEAFYRNFGNLLPEDFKAALRDEVRRSPDDEITPANPTLCATPDQIEEFCSVRAQILEGRASPEQIEALCRRPIEDFDAIAGVLQDGIPATIMNNMPPLKSDPGCDNGLFPRELDEDVAQISKGLSDGLENLKIAYSYDMLGNGPGKRNWGFVNMVLSDTMGRPYTAHRRKNNFDPGALQYVDFYSDNEAQNEDDDQLNYARAGAQRGALPKYVAEWQTIYYSQNKENFITVNINNEFKPKKKKYIPFKDINSGGTTGIERKNLTRLPDFGYNYVVKPVESRDEDGITIVARPRKKTPDLLLKWRDNAGGGSRASIPPVTSIDIPEVELIGEDGKFQLGYNLKFFFADFEGKKNRKDDNVRLEIVELQDIGVFLSNAADKLAGSSFAGAAADFDPDPEEDPKTSIRRDTVYEFMSFDNGLDSIIDETGAVSGDYPNFAAALEQEQPTDSPTLILMSEMLGVPVGQAKRFWDSTIQLLMDEMGKKIFDLDNNKAFRYGARNDDLSPSEAEYGVIRGGNFVLYSDAENSEGNALTNSDAELGLSRDQFNNRDNPERARIVYLDPAAFGGSYTNPKYYIKPVDNTGWLGLINVMFPELSPCKPYRTDLVDFADIDSVMSNSYSSSPDDRRLLGDPDCVTEKPYDRILDRSAKAGIKGTIMAACRIYASINFMKSIATFSKFRPDFKNNFSNLYASYIVEEMEKGMKDSQSGFAELFNPFKDEEFWYAFLEQVVQTYHDQVEAGEIIEVPNNVQNALREIAQVQRDYKYPGKKMLKTAKSVGDAGRLQTLKSYRENKNLEAVKASEEHAKVILKEFVAKEVDFIAGVFENNLIKEDFIDKDDYVNNIYYHILSEHCDGSSLTLDREIREEVSGLGEGGYTDGDEFSLEEDGTPYVGYYHVHEDSTGQPVFMVGEEHSEEDHATLVPFARKVTVNIGNVTANINETPGGTKPFVIKKYLKVDGQRKDMDYVQSIAAGDSNVSDEYPGTLDFVYEASIDAGLDDFGAVVTEEPAESRPGKPIVGLKGELGIRYGLAIFARTSSGLREIANSEIDALDLPLKLLKPLEGESKELLCLINSLIDDPRFRAFFSYCLPINKILSGLAIYNSFTFLPSIGELTADAKKRQILDGLGSKPGLRITDEGNTDFDGSYPGWYKPSQRPNFTPFSLTWDEWDKITLRRSNDIIKKMFKSYYYSRSFDEGREDDERGGKIVIKNLKELFSLAPGQRIMPWWKRRSSNPFNDKDELCERKE